MPRARTPKAKAIATGRVLHDPKRFRDRIEPLMKNALGKAPSWMKKASQVEAWQTFSDELPWLNQSHRSLVEIAASIRARVMMGDDIGIKALNLLRQCLGSMGATPADSSKVTMPAEMVDDPADKYFS